MWIFISLLVASHVEQSAARQCLDHAVPEGQRLNVTLDGRLVKISDRDGQWGIHDGKDIQTCTLWACPKSQKDRKVQSRRFLDFDFSPFWEAAKTKMITWENPSTLGPWHADSQIHKLFKVMLGWVNPLGPSFLFTKYLVNGFSSP